MSKEKVQTHEIGIVLGGGRTNSGVLTELSKQRLKKACELYEHGVIVKVAALGGHYSTYSPNAIFFERSGADIRKDYLHSHGVPFENIILVPNGRDTILEAFACREVIRKSEVKRILIVTSDKHMKRALFIFRRIFGENFTIKGEEVSCGDILDENEEKEYLNLVREFLDNFSEEIPDPDLKIWIKNQKDYYHRHKKIHDKYHSKGKESQAYMGVRDENGINDTLNS